MGPTCEVLLESDDDAVLDTIDSILTTLANRIDRTPKGRVWDLWVGDRPVHVFVQGPPPAVTLAAGCNSAEDYAILRRLAAELASSLGGVASEPVK